MHLVTDLKQTRGIKNTTLKVAQSTGKIACVVSVSVEQRAKNGVLGVLPARKMGRTARKRLLRRLLGRVISLSAQGQLSLTAAQFAWIPVN